MLLVSGFVAVGVNSSGACGALANADPLNACSPLRNGRRSNETEKARFALIVRGECTFKDKIQNAQNAGFGAAIVYDDKDGSDLISSEPPFTLEFRFAALIVLNMLGSP